MKKQLLTAAGLLSLGAISTAATVAINNHSFETGAGLPTNGGYNGNTPEGWTGLNSRGLQHTTTPPAGVDGNYFVFLQGDNGAIRQDITAALGGSTSVGDVFTLTLAAANQNSSPTFDFDIQNSAGASLIGGPKTSATLPGGTVWADRDVIGTIDTASTDIFLFIESNGPQVRVDNVRLDVETIPEPSSSMLLGLAGTALLLRRRK